MASALVPLLSVNLSAEFDPILGASDASNIGLGVSEALLESPKIAQELEAWLVRDQGWQSLGITPSPIEGGDGNQEYLLAGQKSGATERLDRHGR